MNTPNRASTTAAGASTFIPIPRTTSTSSPFASTINTNNHNNSSPTRELSASAISRRCSLPPFSVTNGYSSISSGGTPNSNSNTNVPNSINSNIGFVNLNSSYPLPPQDHQHQYVDDPLIDETAKEWNVFGIDIPIPHVAKLHEELSETTSRSETSSTSQQEGPSSSSFGTGEIVSYSFGGERWKVELVRMPNPRFSAPSTPTDSDGEKIIKENKHSSLSLYLICHLLEYDYPNTILEVNGKIMVGIREPNEQAGQKQSRHGWLWKEWQNWTFSREHEYWGCHNFPSLNFLLENERVKALDSFVLSVQVHLSVGDAIPQMNGFHHVPSELFDGIGQLLDDPTTADVKIIVREINEPSPNTTAVNESPQVQNLHRKRVLYAHSAILKARSSYFETMLSSNWAEGPEQIFDGDRSRSLHKIIIEDFDFKTIYWLLRWFYTNEIKFIDSEDARSSFIEDLPAGLINDQGSGLGWDWKPIDPSYSESGCLRPPSQLSESATNDSELERIPSRSSFNSKKSSSKGASTVSSTIVTSSAIPVNTTLRNNKRQSQQGLNSFPLNTNTTTTTTTTTTSSSSTSSTSPSNITTHDSFISDQTSCSSNASIPPYSPPGQQQNIKMISRASSSSSRSTNTLPAGVSSITSSPHNANIKKTNNNNHNSNNKNNSKNNNKYVAIQDPHKHPTIDPGPASALAVYKLAHRYNLSNLSNLALNHIVSTLTPSTAFPLMLATHLWPELHEAIKNYALINYVDIVRDPEFRRCYAEVGEGLWDKGGEVLFNFTTSLAPIQST